MWGEVLTHGVGVFVGVITVQYSDEVCMRYGSNGGMLKLRLVFHNIFKDRHEYGLKTLEGVVARHLIKCRVKIDFATDALDLRVRLPLPFYDRVELGQMGFVLTGEKQIAQSHLNTLLRNKHYTIRHPTLPLVIKLFIVTREVYDAVKRLSPHPRR